MRVRMNRTKVNLFLRYLAITLIPIFVLVATGTISIIINDRYVARQIREASARTLEQIRNSVDFTFAELDSLDIILSSSSEFLAALSRILTSPDLDLEQSKLLSVLQNFVNVSAYARRDVESIYVYISNDRDRFMTTTDGIVDLGGYSDRDWYLGYLSHAEDDASWTETRVLNRLPAVELGRPVVTIYRRLYPLAGVRMPGVVVLNIHRRFFADLLGQMKGSPDQRIVILDEDGSVVYTDFTDTGVPWNGDGADTVGLYDPSAAGVHLKNANVTGGGSMSPVGAGSYAYASLHVTPSTLYRAASFAPEERFRPCPPMSHWNSSVPSSFVFGSSHGSGTMYHDSTPAGGFGVICVWPYGITFCPSRPGVSVRASCGHTAGSTTRIPRRSSRRWASSPLREWTLRSPWPGNRSARRRRLWPRRHPRSAGGSYTSASRDRVRSTPGCWQARTSPCLPRATSSSAWR